MYLGRWKKYDEITQNINHKKLTNKTEVCTCECCVNENIAVEPFNCGCKTTCNNCKSRKRRRTEKLATLGYHLPVYVVCLQNLVLFSSIHLIH